ncbi:MAG TPA: hypothetical protein IAC34_07695 [Candidatus Coprenecus stercoripullorum]|nr:hypothetical protein [Candidatus Coprenecus stercoripullorum]
MDKKAKKYIEEILLKEDERYCLISLGFFRDIDTEAEFILNSVGGVQPEGDFLHWKRRLLREYYRLRDFSTFCRRNISNAFFEKMVRRLILGRLDRMRMHNGRTEADRYLAPDNDTVSYSMSPETFEGLYAIYFSNLGSFSCTEDLYNTCAGIVSAHFPTDDAQIVSCLEENNSFYWEKLYRKLRPITAGFCYQMTGISGDNNIHDIWSDTCCTLNASITGGKLEKPVTPKAILSYAAGIIKNKNREVLRNRQKSPYDIEDIKYRLTDEADENFFDSPMAVPGNFPSQSGDISTNIDFADEDTRRRYMVVVLYNEDHPWHARLVEGMEDRVQRLFEHYIDGLSYEDIVRRHYGELPPSEGAKAAAKVRQEIKRLKDRLIERFDKIVKEYR